jgi:hypothetical protein
MWEFLFFVFAVVAETGDDIRAGGIVRFESECMSAPTLAVKAGVRTDMKLL